MSMWKRFLTITALVGLLFFPGDRLLLPYIVESAQGQVPVGRLIEYNVPFTPVATAASIGLSEQTVTVTGLATTDVVFVNGPAATALCPAVTYRVSAANTLAVGYATMTAAACTPSAGTLNIIAIR